MLAHHVAHEAAADEPAAARDDDVSGLEQRAPLRKELGKSGHSVRRSNPILVEAVYT